MKSLSIRSSQRIYSVDFSQTIAELEAQLELSHDSKALFFIDENVFEIYKNSLSKLIGDNACLCIKAEESEKTLDGATKIFNFMQEQQTDKATKLIAIGGGIIQDLMSFCAHLYYRGLEWILIPTTLLSMADSCIGAKSSINLNKFKNQLGSFHAPSQILICLEFINSLEKREIKSGYGEIIKLHLIKSKQAYLELENNLLEKGFNQTSLLDFIRESLATKKTYIEEDEFDQGIRKILNYGHSLGHALETSSKTYVPHGLAVSWGINFANFLAYKTSRLDFEYYERVKKLINKLLLEDTEIKVNAKLLIEALKRDKKTINNSLNFVFLNKDTKMSIEKLEIDSKLEEYISEFLNQKN